MWTSLEEDALTVGVPYDLFWGDMTPSLLKKYISAYDRRLADLDRLNHSLGIYIGMSVNNPKKYPKEPFLSKAPKKHNKNMGENQMKEEAKRIAIMFGGKIK